MGWWCKCQRYNGPRGVKPKPNAISKCADKCVLGVTPGCRIDDRVQPTMTLNRSADKVTPHVSTASNHATSRPSTARTGTAAYYRPSTISTNDSNSRSTTQARPAGHKDVRTGPLPGSAKSSGWGNFFVRYPKSEVAALDEVERRDREG